MNHSLSLISNDANIQAQAASLLDLSSSLTLGRITFTFCSEDNTRLPPFLGSTLRGALGGALRSIACVRERGTNCLTCALCEGCAYAYLFETPVPSAANRLRRLQHLPHPFIIEPPPLQPGGLNLEPGSLLTFSMVLIGKATTYLPYVLLAASRMGAAGLGAERAVFQLIKAESDLPGWLMDAVESGESQRDDSELAVQAAPSSLLLWTPDSAAINGLPKVTPSGLQKVLSMQPTEAGAAGERVQVEFTTPVRLVEQGRVVSNLEFRVFIRSLLSRVSSLAIFHCGQDEQDLDYRSLVDAADMVNETEQDLSIRPLQRWSQRQQRTIGLDGLLGGVAWRGEIMPLLLPLIRIGQIVHVGKGTVFGLGRYRLL